MRDEAGSKIAIERIKRAANIGAAGPAQNTARDLFQSIGDIFGPNQMRNAAERGAEHKRLHAPKLVLKTIHELDQKAAVTIHRPAHIAKQHDAGFLDAPFAIDQFDEDRKSTRLNPVTPISRMPSSA